MMRARQPFTYDGHRLDAGEVFELSEPTTDGKVAVHRVLTIAGLAETYVGDSQPTRRPNKRRYKRRDLRAEK